MFGIGSRTFFAVWNNTLLNFESKVDRDYFVAHSDKAKIISAKEAYRSGQLCNAVRITASTAIGANKERRLNIFKWRLNRDNK